MVGFLHNSATAYVHTSILYMATSAAADVFILYTWLMVGFLHNSATAYAHSSIMYMATSAAAACFHIVYMVDCGIPS